MEELICREGTVHSVIFQNAENGYTVLRLLTEEGEVITVVGCIPCVAPGEHLTVTGIWETHPQHGEQLKAQELEREVEKLKKCEYMLDHIGEEYDGIVSGVTEFGVYVELPNTVEGMVFARDLRRPYQLGEQVRIRVLDARPAERQIDFAMLRK